MNFELQKALHYIDLQETEKAISCLKTAIQQELDSGNEAAATECRCVLGELYALDQQKDESREQFEKVMEYSVRTGELMKQREIAVMYLAAFDGKLPAPGRRPGDAPLVAKPVQNKGFISKQMNKRHR
ncbi:MAG: tetratricopeptide repeat protein [Oscillospiraceae bacterium]|nr:tetratricopeptide repeat protein [Oscillospiraceae bacterium]